MKRLVLVAGLLSSVNAWAVDSVDFKSLAAQCAPGVHIKTLSSIVRHESGVNPYAIGVNAKGAKLPRQPANKEEAVATATWLKEHGYNFDSGFGQVNSSNMDWLGLSVSDLFDPCKNLAGAARVITDCYQRAKNLYRDEQSALHAALSCYNTGDFKKGISNGYVMAVASNATLDVPGLMPIASGGAEPIRLKATKSPANAASATAVQPNTVKPLPDGIGDAFSRPSGGAFAPKQEPQQESQTNEPVSQKSEPVMLQRE